MAELRYQIAYLDDVIVFRSPMVFLPCFATNGDFGASCITSGIRAYGRSMDRGTMKCLILCQSRFMSREGHVRKVEHNGDQRNLIGRSNTLGGGLNHSMAAFNRKITRRGAWVDGNGSDWRSNQSVGHFRWVARTFY